MMKPIRLLLLLALLLTACGPTTASPPGEASEAPANAVKITLAYSPEKEAWLNDRLAEFNRSGAKVNNRPIFAEGVNKSSGAARTEIKQGSLQPTIWSPSSSVWLEVLKQESGNPNVAVSSRPMLLTPVVISMWKPMAEALGWPNKQIGWNDLLALVNEPEGWGKYGHPEWGRFSWGHTDPEISTTALSTVLAEFYAATNKSRGLTEADVQAESSQKFLRDLGLAIKHYGYNTLVFSENMKKYGTSYISAFPMEEITLIEFNKSAPPTPLVAIYPREGTFWHDNPFIVMASASQEEQQAAQQLFDFLNSPESQTAAMQFGFRPANTAVAIGDPISPQFGADPNQPQTLLEVPPGNVLVAAKNAWAANRKRANIVLVVDTSGSMRGDKIEEAKAGLELFLSRLLPEDRVAMVTFSDTAEVVVPLGVLSENRIQLQSAVQNIEVEGKTAMYDALREARKVLEADIDDRNRINAIVLLSDGEDTAQTSTFEDVRADYNETDISIFPIAYGEDAAKDALQQIADFTRTIVISGSTGDINKVFENLSRYF
ncbi:MAG TPA: VWA domain-containing protein [Herpetosiphonaceae bacterium]